MYVCMYVHTSNKLNILSNKDSWKKYHGFHKIILFK